MLLNVIYPRFIPVHTGNTRHFIKASKVSPVHPRAYGEHVLPRIPVGNERGSSPCIRGTRGRLVSIGFVCRFIPVHTGNTNQGPQFVNQRPVHPRAYGEHHGLTNGPEFDAGSSPCIRGTHPNLTIGGERTRFIPVHTGNTLRAVVRGLTPAVHPRAYGEH